MGSQNQLHTKTVVSIPAASYANTAAAAAATVAVDTRGFRWALVSWNASAVGTTLDGTVQASAASGSGYADISGADFTQLDGAGVATVLVDTKGTARYLKLDPTLSGTCVFGATVTLYEPSDTANVGASEHDAVVTF